MNFLIVDDEEIVRHVLREFISLLNHRYQEASDGLSGLRMLEEGSFDAVFADMRMPGLNGLGFLKKCGQKWPDLPVILISGHGSEQIREESIAAGALGFLNKPFKFEEFRQMVEVVSVRGIGKERT